MKKQRRRWLALAAAATTLTAGAVMPRPAAQAWTWSSSVTVNGFANCGTGTPALVPARAIWMHLDATGEIEQASVNPIGYFEEPFHTVPSGSSHAEVWLYCSVPGSTSGWRFAGDTTVSRPWIGSYPAYLRVFTA